MPIVAAALRNIGELFFFRGSGMFAETPGVLRKPFVLQRSFVFDIVCLARTIMFMPSLPLNPLIFRLVLT
jgi:hypothetical protein